MSPGAEIPLELLLRRADVLVAAASAMAVALEDVGGIELPLPGGAVDQAQLRALATLYLAAELEGAGAIPAAEALVRLARSGSLARDLGGATPLVQAFWQSRNERIGGGERLAIFARLFGTGGGADDAQTQRNASFEERMIDLCDALYRLDEAGAGPAPGGVAQQARVRGAARGLLDAVIRTSGSFTALVAQELLETLKLALAILAHPAVKAAFGARSVWDVVAAIDRSLRAPPRPHALHLRRGQAGMTLLAWLADTAPRLGPVGGPLVTIDSSVIEAAVDWLEASLALGEGAAAPVPAGSGGAVGSDWSSFAE
jgi:hypothetical protein